MRTQDRTQKGSVQGASLRLENPFWLRAWEGSPTAITAVPFVAFMFPVTRFHFVAPFSGFSGVR